MRDRSITAPCSLDRVDEDTPTSHVTTGKTTPPGHVLTGKTTPPGHVITGKTTPPGYVITGKTTPPGHVVTGKTTPPGHVITVPKRDIHVKRDDSPVENNGFRNSSADDLDEKWVPPAINTPQPTRYINIEYTQY
jgi:hypothetical protein